MASGPFKSLFQETRLGFIWCLCPWFLLNQDGCDGKESLNAKGSVSRGNSRVGRRVGSRCLRRSERLKGALVVVRGVERHG